MKKAVKQPAGPAKGGDAINAAQASTLIDGRIAELGDWRGQTLARMRALIRQAVPEVIETWKWRGVPAWEKGGIICTGETYKAVVKLTFAKGASLPDPAGLFNASLDGNMRRAIDIPEGGKVDANAFKALVRAAALNSPKEPNDFNPLASRAINTLPQPCCKRLAARFSRHRAMCWSVIWPIFCRPICLSTEARPMPIRWIRPGC